MTDIMKTRFFALAALALALAACNNDNEILNNDGPVAARFIADIAPVTRASGTTWTGGDRIGVTDIGNDTRYGNVPFILKNGKFEAEEKVIYIEDVKTHTFRAYYPYNAAGGTLAATTDATAQAEPACHRLPLCFRSHGRQKQPGGELHRQNRQRRCRQLLPPPHEPDNPYLRAGDGVDFSMIKPERYTLGGLILTGTFNTADGIATADDGAQAETLAMELADGKPHVIGHPLPADSCIPAIDCELQKSELSCHAHRARRRTAGGQQLYLYRQGTQQRA